MEVSVISIMNNAYHFNLYIKGNPLIKGTLSCSLSALYIQVWLYLYVFRINFTPKIVLHMMKTSILLATTNCASEYDIYKRINKTENTFLFNQVSWCLIYIITIYIQRKCMVCSWQQHLKSWVSNNSLQNICSDCLQFELMHSI